jgi:hypothetical protein
MGLHRTEDGSSTTGNNEAEPSSNTEVKSDPDNNLGMEAKPDHDREINPNLVRQ